jgi:hypothetical protein
VKKGFIGAMPELMSSRRRVVLRDERKARQAQVALALEKAEEHLAQLVYAVFFHVVSSSKIVFKATKNAPPPVKHRGEAGFTVPP